MRILNFCCQYMGCICYEDLINDCSFMYNGDGIIYPHDIYQLSVNYRSAYYINTFSFSKRHEKLLQNLLNGTLAKSVFGNKAATFRKFRVLSNYLPHCLTSSYRTPAIHSLPCCQGRRRQHHSSSWAEKGVCCDMT